MTTLDAHIRFEALIAEAMRAPDPALALSELRADPRVPVALQTCLDAIDLDGARISALLIARLRFERLLHGSVRAQEWFDGDGEAFANAFRVYHQTVKPEAALPSAEARLFEEWLQEFGRP